MSITFKKSDTVIIIQSDSSNYPIGKKGTVEKIEQGNIWVDFNTKGLIPFWMDGSGPNVSVKKYTLLQLFEEDV